MTNVELLDSLILQYEMSLCRLHEFCFYAEYDPSDFIPPYSISLPGARSRASDFHPITPAHLSSVVTCISSAHALLDLFISSTTITLQCAPVIVYARMGYAIVILLKVYISAALPTGALYGVFNASETNLELYLEQTTHRLTEVDAQRCRTASFWLTIVAKITDWFRRHFVPTLGMVGTVDEPGVVESSMQPGVDEMRVPRASRLKTSHACQSVSGSESLTLNFDPSFQDPTSGEPPNRSTGGGTVSSSSELFSGLSADSSGTRMGLSTSEFGEADGFVESTSWGDLTDLVL